MNCGVTQDKQKLVALRLRIHGDEYASGQQHAKDRRSALPVVLHEDCDAIAAPNTACLQGMSEATGVVGHFPITDPHIACDQRDVIRATGDGRQKCVLQQSGRSGDHDSLWSGRDRLRLLSFDEGNQIVHGIKILRQHLVIIDRDSERLFYKVHDLQDSGGIDYPAGKKRVAILQQRFVVGKQNVFQ
jgi:hypothetical protein